MTNAPKSNLKLTLIGGPTVLIEINGVRLLTDPTFDPPGVLKTEPVRFEKTSGPALTVDEVLPIDAVLLSHDQHLDNLDVAGRAFLPHADQVFTTASGAERLGGKAIGLAPFETREFRTVKGDIVFVTATPARHGPVGIEPISGDVVGFLIGLREPGDALYVTGDTVWYEGIAEIARRFSPKIVMLFTGAAEPRGRFRMTMASNDAIEAAHAFPNATITAVHNEGWVHFKENAEELAATFRTLGIADRFVSLERGQTASFAL